MAFTAVAQTPLALWLCWSMPAPWSLLASGALVLLVPYLALGRIRLGVDDRPVSTTRQLFEAAYYAYWSGSALGLLFWLLAAPLWLAADLPFEQVTLLTALLGLGAGVWGALITPRRVRQRTLKLRLKDLPPALEGLRIAHWSDLHIGSQIPPERVVRWRQMTERMRPDLIALTGDFATTGTRFHQAIAEQLGALRAPLGVFAVLGNHDNFGQDVPLAAALRESGVSLLMNEHRELVHRGVAIDVVGVDDHYTGRADVDAAFAGVRSSAFVLGLVHNPKAFRELADRGARLVLAGHTHWGQIAVPGFAKRFNFAARYFRYSAGLYHHQNAMLWVHPGLGATGLPLRIGVRPEITLIELSAG